MYPDSRLLASYTRGLAPPMAISVPTPTRTDPMPIRQSITIRSTTSVPISLFPTPIRLSSNRIISPFLQWYPFNRSRCPLSSRRTRTFRQLSLKSCTATNIMPSASVPPIPISTAANVGTGISFHTFAAKSPALASSRYPTLARREFLNWLWCRRRKRPRRRINGTASVEASVSCQVISLASRRSFGSGGGSSRFESSIVERMVGFGLWIGEGGEMRVSELELGCAMLVFSFCWSGVDFGHGSVHMSVSCWCRVIWVPVPISWEG